MMKKRMSLGIMAVLIAAMLTGCGKEQAVDNTDPGATGAEAPESTDQSQDNTGEGQAEDDSESNLGIFWVDPENGVLDFDMAGIKIKLPEELLDRQDRIRGYAFVERTYGQVALLYIPEGASEQDLTHPLTIISAQRKAFDLGKDINTNLGFTADMYKDYGSNGTFYYLGECYDRFYEVNPEAFDEQIFVGLSEEQKEEYLGILAHITDILNMAQIVEVDIPEPLSAETFDNNMLMTLELDDLDHNKVKVGDIIAANKITMINFWGTFCGPCIREMPDLESLSQEYADKGFTIIGLTSDIVSSDGSYDDALIQDARDIVEDTGVTYPVLITNKEFKDYCELEAYPTTYLVDSNGTLICDPIVGSKTMDEWKEKITEALAAQN